MINPIKSLNQLTALFYLLRLKQEVVLQRPGVPVEQYLGLQQCFDPFLKNISVPSTAPVYTSLHMSTLFLYISTKTVLLFNCLKVNASPWQLFDL